MKWQLVTAVRAIVLVLTASTAGAQTWTSTDVGDVGVAGSATFSGSTWTVQGDGDNIWGAADSFQFLHTRSAATASIVARVDSLSATSTFAKAGVMVRDTLAANSATAILDVRPNGAIEFMDRVGSSAQMQFLATASVTFPVWLRLSWAGDVIESWTSQDGNNWTFVGHGGIVLGATPEAGLAVTSQNHGQVAKAQFTGLAMGWDPTSGWSSTDVGAVGMSGSAMQVKDTWTVQGAGGNIWGDLDAFHFLYRPVGAAGVAFSVVSRINDLQNTSPFAKAGVMIRANLRPDSATVILDVRPTGEVEFMERGGTGATMHYIAGTSVTLPAWLRLDVASSGEVTARVSEDRNVWTPLSQTVTIAPPPQYLAGAAVTSQTTSRLNTAHIAGLTLLTLGWESIDVGGTGLIGNAARDTALVGAPVVVQGAGSDIWGTADSFQFVDAGPAAQAASASARVVSVRAANSFAKGGVMFRDGVAPFAADVILDARPDGNIEFMARLCPGCQTTFIAGTKVTLPAFLSLFRNGSTFSAEVTTGDGRTHIELGTVTVTMAAPRLGYAVTSHDTTQLATVIFDNPPD
jgi:hypothetical protein